MTEGERQKVRERLEAQSAHAQELLEPYRDNLTKLARALVNQGYLTGEEVGHFLPDLTSAAHSGGSVRPSISPEQTTRVTSVEGAQDRLTVQHP